MLSRHIVRCWCDGTERWPSEDVLRLAESQEVGEIRVSSGKLPHGKGAIGGRQVGPEPRLEPGQVQRLFRSNVDQFGVVAHGKLNWKSQPYNTRDTRARGSRSDTMAPLEVCLKRVVNGLDALEALVGTDLGTSQWLTVTQEMVNTFSEVTGDHQWIHLDV